MVHSLFQGHCKCDKQISSWSMLQIRRRCIASFKVSDCSHHTVLPIRFPEPSESRSLRAHRTPGALRIRRRCIASFEVCECNKQISSQSMVWIRRRCIASFKVSDCTHHTVLPIRFPELPEPPKALPESPDPPESRNLIAYRTPGALRIRRRCLRVHKTLLCIPRLLQNK